MKKVKRFFQRLIRRLLSKLGVLPELKIIINDDMCGLDNITIMAEGIPEKQQWIAKNIITENGTMPKKKEINLMQEHAKNYIEK